ncbi:hypothetical protein [Sphingomonas sp.]|jgi:hypothetical protein|uniref:hypothetical protein n=1 Tax=Sphingomonas sp. TaxID=28214 RepID=UPI002ED83506
MRGKACSSAQVMDNLGKSAQGRHALKRIWLTVAVAIQCAAAPARADARKSSTRKRHARAQLKDLGQ